MPFENARVLALESRRAKEIAELIRRSGGDPFVAPALVEVPLTENEHVFDFADQLRSGNFDMMIFLTGVGARVLAQALQTRGRDLSFIEDLREVTVVARGPKPVAVLREWNVPVAVTVPEPNTWRELLLAVHDRPELSVALQEYGRSNVDLVDGLRMQGRTVQTIPVYQWKLPEDTAPLKEAVQGLVSGKFNAALFTTSVQIEHLLLVAEATGQEDEVLAALSRLFIGSIGPTCSAALAEHGLPIALEPSHPKMGILVQEAAAAFGASPQ